MPIQRTYHSGAIIYMEGDKSEYVYVVRSGKVALLYADSETMADVVDQLSPGDFFGVKGVLGNYKREEVCKAQSEVQLLLLNKKEFAELITRNFNLVSNMLKVFSTQLRQIGKKASELVSATANTENQEVIQELTAEENLFHLGEYYLAQQNYSYALYVFRKYVALYPQGSFYGKAQEQLKYIGSQGGEAP